MKKLNMPVALLNPSKATKDVENDQVWNAGKGRVGAAECATTKIHLLRETEPETHTPQLRKVSKR